MNLLVQFTESIRNVQKKNMETQLNSTISWIELTSIDVFVVHQQILKLIGAFGKEDRIWDHKTPS